MECSSTQDSSYEPGKRFDGCLTWNKIKILSPSADQPTVCEHCHNLYSLKSYKPENTAEEWTNHNIIMAKQRDRVYL